MAKNITGVACVDANGFYAPKDGGPLPWPASAGDLSWFRFLTDGGIVVVGNNTYQELQKLPPLKNREIWPVGRNHELKTVAEVLDKYVALEDERPLFVGGGKALWEGFGDYMDHFYLTVLKTSWIEKGLEIDDLYIIADDEPIIENDKYKIYQLC